jgi:hypothetical protein
MKTSRHLAPKQSNWKRKFTPEVSVPGTKTVPLNVSVHDESRSTSNPSHKSGVRLRGWVRSMVALYV